MLVVLDEWFHFENFPAEHYAVKPLKIGRKHQSLQQSLKQEGSGWLSKRLPLKPYSIAEELEFFTKLVTEQETILYFYEPRYTSTDNLYRVRNWLLPEKQLYPVPVYGNRAEVLYLMHHLVETLGQKRTVTYQELQKDIKGLKDQATCLIISPEPTRLVEWKKLNSVYKGVGKKQYCLVKVEEQQKIKTSEIGELAVLWRKVLKEEASGGDIWAVCKGVAEELVPSKHFYRVGEPAPPVNVPFVHAVVVPKEIEQERHRSA